MTLSGDDGAVETEEQKAARIEEAKKTLEEINKEDPRYCWDPGQWWKSMWDALCLRKGDMLMSWINYCGLLGCVGGWWCIEHPIGSISADVQRATATKEVYFVVMLTFGKAAHAGWQAKGRLGYLLLSLEKGEPCRPVLGAGSI